MIQYTASYTDQYELTMAQAYFQKGKKDKTAIFDYFFRKLPFGGGYALFAGLEDLIDVLEHLRFDERDLIYLQNQGLNSDFIGYLENFRFSGNVYSCREGEVVFPICPIVVVEAPIIEAQIIETLLLNILNIQTLVATKASRMRHVAGDRALIDFGLRRAQGAGGYSASRAAFIGGFNSTSNVRAGRDYHIPVAGTMAHSFVQSYDNELDSFRDFAEVRSDDCVLLVDTYDTLKSGVPNAIITGKEMEARGQRLKGIRLDSGDLAWLSKKSRQMLDNAGLHYVKITASNKLDEIVIQSLIDQEAPIDAFGVGTRLVTGHPDAALDGVYKLAFANDRPRIKLSENILKINLPDKKQVYRILNNGLTFYGADVIALADEDAEKVGIMHHPSEAKSLHIESYDKEPLLQKVIENGKRLQKPLALKEIADFSKYRLNKLPPEFKRFVNPHKYKAGLSDKLNHERDELIEKIKKNKSGAHSPDSFF